jgi:hypothetical protein
MQAWFISQVDDGLEQFQLIKWCHECMEIDPSVWNWSPRRAA